MWLQTKTETKRPPKAKNDTIFEITDSMGAFMMLSGIIRISNITPDRAWSLGDNIKCIRQKYTDLPETIIGSTLIFDLWVKNAFCSTLRACKGVLHKIFFSWKRCRTCWIPSLYFTRRPYYKD